MYRVDSNFQDYIQRQLNLKGYFDFYPIFKTNKQKNARNPCEYTFSITLIGWWTFISSIFFCRLDQNGNRDLTKFNERINVYIPGPLIRKKKAPVSLATARAIKVLPVPGGPNSKIPLGGFTPIALNKLKKRKLNF